MDECLIVHSRAISKVYIFYIFVFAINIISFIIGTVNYCLSRYSLKYLEENDPDIDLTGIKSFSFNYIPSKANNEYYYGITNLGNTGKIYLVCYKGVCKYYTEYDCSKTVCEEDEYGEETCWEETDTCKKSKSFDDISASRECRTSKSCSRSSCGGTTYYNQETYYYSGCHCDTDKNAKNIGGDKSCNADNLIFNFEYYYFSKENATKDFTKYSYLQSAVTKNESCSEGKKFCGYLDDLGNKLCYDENEECPMNIITSNETNYTYLEYFNKKIYYTKEPDEEKDNHRVLGGFFVDTDLMINYNVDNGDCQNITTGKISTLLESHSNTLYRNSLKFNPYKEKNIDQRGKSYLKWCIPGHGKEKNIDLIKDLFEVYKFNLTTNKDSIKPIKTRYVASYFTSLPGHLGLIISWVFLLLLFNYKNNSSLSVGFNSTKTLITYFGLIISLILIFIGSMLSITYNSEISKSDKMDLGQTIFSSLIRLNITYLTFVIILIIGIIVFFVYISITPKTIFEVSKPEQSFNLMEQENYKKNDDYSNSNNNYNNDKQYYNNTGYNNNYNYNYNNADYMGLNYNNNTNNNTYNSNDTNKGFTGGGGVY